MFDFNPWEYRPNVEAGSLDLTGYGVEALDGSIGKIDDATHQVGGSYVVVDTGPWIFGKKVMLPAGTIERIDTTDRKVFVDRTKGQIKNAPEFDEDQYGQPAYREKLAGYYGTTYGTDEPPRGAL